MALTREERSSLIATLDKCDAALADKPTLSKIFGGKWRTRFREQILGVDSFVDAVSPKHTSRLTISISQMITSNVLKMELQSC